MSRQSAQFLEISNGYEAFQQKKWSSDGLIHTEHWMVGHAIQPHDHIAYPELSRHLLVLLLQPNYRQMIRFAGQEFNGAGQTNTFFLLPTDIGAEFSWESEDRVIFFDISPNALRQMAVQTDCLDPDHIELMPLVWAQDDQIARFSQCFFHEIHTGGPGEHLYRESLFTGLAIHLLRRYCTQPVKLPAYDGGLSKQRLRRALAVIHDSLDQSLSLATIAAEVGLDRYYFSRLFRQSMGVSPYQYVLQQRVEKAKQLLQNSDRSIAEISMDCGFANPSHLARHFRKVIGVSPKAYRQQAQ